MDGAGPYSVDISQGKARTAALTRHPSKRYEDIIAGGRRLVEKADGYRAIIVNGVITFTDGDCTEALPGRVLRTSAYNPEFFHQQLAAE